MTVPPDPISAAPAVQGQVQGTLQGEEIHAYQALWRAVLQRLLRDLCEEERQRSHDRRAGLARQEAESWIGTFPRREFCTVCDLLDLDPGVTHARLSALVRLPLSERRTIVRRTLALFPHNATRPCDIPPCDIPPCDLPESPMTGVGRASSTVTARSGRNGRSGGFPSDAGAGTVAETAVEKTSTKVVAYG